MEAEPSIEDVRQVEGVIEALAAEHPHVAHELERLEPPPRTSARLKLLKPPLTVRLTIAAAGAAAVKPGMHYIHFFSPGLDVRPEILRMLAELSRSDKHPEVRVFSRHRRAILAGLGSGLTTEDEWNAVEQRMVIYSRSEALRHLVLPEGRRYTLLVDLDDLAKSIGFTDLYTILQRDEVETILLMGNREHPLLSSYRYAAQRHPEWIQWGVSREQVQGLDSSSTALALDALRHLNPTDFKALPSRFADVDRERVIPPQLRKIPVHERRIWCTISASYAVDSATRRDSVNRSIVPVDADVDPVLQEAAARVRDVSRRLSRGLVVSLGLSRAVDDLAYYANLPQCLSLPLAAYIRHLGPSPVTRLTKPVDRLIEIAEACVQASGDAEALRAEVRDIALSLETFYLDEKKLKEPPAKTAKLVELMNETLSQAKPFALLAINRAEAEAAAAYFAVRIGENSDQGPTRSEKRRLLSVVEARHFSPRGPVGTVAIARTPTAEIVDKVVDAPVERFVAIVARSDEARASSRIYFDRYRETTLLGPTTQAGAVANLLSTASKPPLPRLTLGQPPGTPRSLSVQPGAAAAGRNASTAAPSEEDDDESLLEAIFQHHDVSGESKATPDLRTDMPPRRVILPSAHVVIEYEDGTRELLADEDVLLRISDNKSEPDAIKVEAVRAGDVLLTTNSAWGSTRLADIVVDLLTNHDPSLNAIDYIDRAWRQAIKSRKESATWDDILAQAHEHGYDNITSLSILFYAKRAVWLPIKKSNLAAVLRAVSPDEFGQPQMVDQIWAGTSRLKSLATRVLLHAKEAAKNTRQTWDDEMSDPVILDEIGLRKSHLDGLFELRRVKVVTKVPAGTEMEL